MLEENRHDTRPWSARRPQSLMLSALLVVVAIALVFQAISSIDEGRGGFVPYLMLVVGPVLAVYYIWYFTIRRFDDDA